MMLRALCARTFIFVASVACATLAAVQASRRKALLPKRAISRSLQNDWRS
jgi:hypothetical protein